MKKDKDLPPIIYYKEKDYDSIIVPDIEPEEFKEYLLNHKREYYISWLYEKDRKEYEEKEMIETIKIFEEVDVMIRSNPEKYDELGFVKEEWFEKHPEDIPQKKYSVYYGKEWQKIRKEVYF